MLCPGEIIEKGKEGQKGEKGEEREEEKQSLVNASLPLALLSSLYPHAFAFIISFLILIQKVSIAELLVTSAYLSTTVLA